MTPRSPPHRSDPSAALPWRRRGEYLFVIGDIERHDDGIATRAVNFAGRGRRAALATGDQDQVSPRAAKALAVAGPIPPLAPVPTTVLDEICALLASPGPEVSGASQIVSI